MKFNFLEVRKENKELKQKIKEIGEDFSFMTKELKKKGGLNRIPDSSGAFLYGLDEDKFILIKQSINLILRKTEKILERHNNIHESVKKNLLRLKEICEQLKNIEWKPYEVEVYENNDFSKKVKRETLTNDKDQNRRFSQLLSDIYHPIVKLENAKFQSIFDSKIEPDRYHI